MANCGNFSNFVPGSWFHLKKLKVIFTTVLVFCFQDALLDVYIPSFPLSLHDVELFDHQCYFISSVLGFHLIVWLGHTGALPLSQTPKHKLRHRHKLNSGSHPWETKTRVNISFQHYVSTHRYQEFSHTHIQYSTFALCKVTMSDSIHGHLLSVLVYAALPWGSTHSSSFCSVLF